MNGNISHGLRNFLIAGMIVCFGFSVSAAGQVIDKEKIYSGIIGTYEFDYQGNILVLDFWVDDGALYGGPEQSDSAEVVPVDLAEMKFEATNEDGQYFELQFKKNEEGVVVSCILKTSGIEIEGPKIK